MRCIMLDAGRLDEAFGGLVMLGSAGQAGKVG